MGELWVWFEIGGGSNVAGSPRLAENRSEAWASGLPLGMLAG